MSTLLKYIIKLGKCLCSVLFNDISESLFLPACVTPSTFMLHFKPPTTKALWDSIYRAAGMTRYVCRCASCIHPNLFTLCSQTQGCGNLKPSSL